MRIITTNSEGMRRLTSAILLYEAPASYNGARAASYATIHPVTTLPEGQPIIGPGSLLKREALQGAITALADGAGLKSYRFTEQSVIASGPGMVAWFTPARPRHMAFTGQTLQLAGVASQPAMLWLAANKELFVFALAEDQRPGKDSIVFHAPFFNVWKGGRLCVGSAQRPTGLDPAEWERMFYESAFSHPNDGANWQTSHRGGITALWRKLLKEKGQKPFPTNTLVSTRATVEQIIDGIMSTGTRGAR